MNARLEVHPATPAERVLVVVQCWFCGKKWTMTPIPDHDRVLVEEGFCPGGCELERQFFDRKPPRRKAAS